MKEVQEGELAVWFRNDHYSVVYKRSCSSSTGCFLTVCRQNRLFALVSDQGMASVDLVFPETKRRNIKNVTWELVSSSKGDSAFFDDRFNQIPIVEEGDRNYPPELEISRELEPLDAEKFKSNPWINLFACCGKTQYS